MSKIQDLIRGGSSDEDIIKECGCSPEQLVWCRHATTIADNHRLLTMENALKLRERLEIAISNNETDQQIALIVRYHILTQKATETTALIEARRNLGVCP